MIRSLLAIAILYAVTANTSSSQQLTREKLEERVAKYCWTNNQHWLKNECKLTIETLQLQFEQNGYRKNDGLLLGRAYRGIAEYSESKETSTLAATRQREIYRTMLKTSKDDPDLLYRYAFSLPDDEAIAVFRELLSVNPQHTTGRAVMAATLQRIGGQENLEEAAKQLQIAYEYDTGSMKRYTAKQAYLAYIRASLYEQAEAFRIEVRRDLRVDEKMAAAEATVALRNKEVAQKLRNVLIVSDIVCIGTYFYVDGLMPCKRVIELLKKLESEYPTNVEVARSFIKPLSQLVLYDDSFYNVLRHVYSKVRQLGASSTDDLYQYALLLDENEQYELLQEIVSSENGVPGLAHFSLGQLHEARGKHPEAVVQYKKAFADVDNKYKRMIGLRLFNLLISLGQEEEAKILKDQLSNTG